MEGFELIKQGAEAKLYKGHYLGMPAIIKERFIKKYRQPELDSHITNDRIKAESRIISRCNSIGINTPLLLLADLENRLIVMQYFENSKTVRDFIQSTNDTQVLKSLAKDIGQMLHKMHKNNIIHGDLTTSNMLLVSDNNNFEDYSNLRLVLIDFGLSYVETSAEDKGVDLYVLERALVSTHSNANELFPVIVSAYGDKEVLKKFEEVRARGRKRTMVG